MSTTSRGGCGEPRVVYPPRVAGLTRHPAKRPGRRSGAGDRRLSRLVDRYRAHRAGRAGSGRPRPVARPEREGRAVSWWSDLTNAVGTYYSDAWNAATGGA